MRMTLVTLITNLLRFILRATLSFSGAQQKVRGKVILLWGRCVSGPTDQQTSPQTGIPKATVANVAANGLFCLWWRVDRGLVSFHHRLTKGQEVTEVISTFSESMTLHTNFRQIRPGGIEVSAWIHFCSCHSWDFKVDLNSNKYPGGRGFSQLLLEII